MNTAQIRHSACAIPKIVPPSLSSHFTTGRRLTSLQESNNNFRIRCMIRIIASKIRAIRTFSILPCIKLPIPFASITSTIMPSIYVVIRIMPSTRPFLNPFTAPNANISTAMIHTIFISILIIMPFSNPQTLVHKRKFVYKKIIFYLSCIV